MNTAKSYARHVTSALEGPRSDSSIDPGGLTIRGFAAATRERLGLPDRMTKSEAEDAYIRHYWMARGCNTMPAVIGWLVCDAFVNHSSRTAAKVVQQALSNVSVDGRFGPKTLRACQDVTDIRAFIKRYANARRGYYAGRSGDLISKYAISKEANKLDQAITQEHGWQNRLDRLFDGLWQAGLIKREPTKVEEAAKTSTAAVVAGAATAVVTGAVPESGGMVEVAQQVAEMAISGNLTAAGIATWAGGWAFNRFIKGRRLIPRLFRKS